MQIFNEKKSFQVSSGLRTKTIKLTKRVTNIVQDSLEGFLDFDL